MLKGFPLVIFLILIEGHVFAQAFSYPQINQTGRSVKDFVPAGWTVLQSAKGDLNRDGIPDVVLVLQHTDTVKLITEEDGNKDTIATQPRLMVVLFKNKKITGYSLAKQSNTFILTNDRKYMEDPLEPIIVRNNILNINYNISYSMGGWYTDVYNYKFRYHNNQFELIGADTYSMHRASHDYNKYSYNFLTRKRVLISGNEERNRRKMQTKILDSHKLMSLSTLTKPFLWEVEPDIFL